MSVEAAANPVPVTQLNKPKENPKVETQKIQDVAQRIIMPKNESAFLIADITFPNEKHTVTIAEIL